MSAPERAASMPLTSAPLTPGPRARALLLLEFVTHERWVYDSRFYPFVLGAARDLGYEARWACFGSRFRLEKTGRDAVRQEVAVDPEDLRRLQAIVATLRPSHVLLSQPVSREVMACLQHGRDDVSVLSLSDHRGADGCLALGDLSVRGRPAPRRPSGRLTGLRLRVGPSEPPIELADWLLCWLGAPDHDPRAGRYLVDAFTPDYDVVMANASARSHRPHLIAMGGLSCDHLGRLADNPHYRGLDLSGCTHDYGCGYCTWYRGATSELTANAMDAFRAQLSRMKATAGARGRFCGFLDVHDVRLLRRLDAVADEILALNLPPTTFCFEPRVDRVLATIPLLERVLPRFARARHSIYFFRMGAENLVIEENERYNKDIGLEQIDRAFAELRRLADAYPGALSFDPTLGYITVSPWTTLEMLELGTRRGLERHFDPLGVWLYTPLLFFRSAPITLVAEREGLLTDRFEDVSPLYEPSVNQVAFDNFLPWRFKDPRTGAAFALMVRFCAAALRGKYPDTLFRGDATYEHLLSREGIHGPFVRPDLFALDAIAAVRAAGAGEDLGGLLELLDGALERHRARALGSTATARPGPLVAPAPRDLSALADAVRRRLRPPLSRLGVVSCELCAEPNEIRLRVTLDTARYDLVLRDRRRCSVGLFQTEHLSVIYRQETPLTDHRHATELRRFVGALDRVFSERAPHLLPGGRSSRAPRGEPSERPDRA